MPVPASINDLSTTAGSNSPAGSEGPQEGDNYIRALSSFIAVLRDKLNGTSPTGEINDATFAGTMAGAATWSALQTFAGGITAANPTFTGTISGVNASLSGDLTVTDDITCDDLTADDVVVDTLQISTGAVSSGTYTPTLTEVANHGAAPTAGVFQWMRVGNVVTVSGSIVIDADSISPTTTTTDISLPVATAFSSAGQCGGTGHTGSAQGGAVSNSGGGSTVVRYAFNASQAAAFTHNLHFTYRVV